MNIEQIEVAVVLNQDEALLRELLDTEVALIGGGEVIGSLY